MSKNKIIQSVKNNFIDYAQILLSNNDNDELFIS